MVRSHSRRRTRNVLTAIGSRKRPRLFARSAKQRSKPMYEVFDRYIEAFTAHTRHPEQNFYGLLKKVVWLDEFNPDTMAEYFRTKLRIPPDDHESYFAKAIDRYCAEAWAIRDFLKHNNVPEQP